MKTKRNKNFFLLVSFIFHPIFLFFYGFLFYNLLDTSFTIDIKTNSLSVLLITVLIPAVIIFILSKGKILLENQQDRYFPYLILFFSYSVAFYFFKNELNFPHVLNILIITQILVWLLLFGLNFFVKVSMHSATISVLFIFTLFLYFVMKYDWSFWVFLLVGFVYVLVGRARLKLKAHSLMELNIGYLVGLVVSGVMFGFIFFICV